MAWNGEDRLTVRHDDMLPLTSDRESSLLEGAHRIKVIDTGNLGQGLQRYLDFSNLFALKLFLDYREVLSDGIPDVLQSLYLRGTLGPTPRQSGYGDAVAFIGFVNRDLVFHGTSAGSIACLSLGRLNRKLALVPYLIE